MKLVMRQIQDLQRSERVKGAAPVPVAVRAAERLERIVSELEVLQHLSFYEIVRVQLKRHNSGVRSISTHSISLRA